MGEMIDRVAKTLNPWIFEAMESSEYPAGHQHRIHLEWQANSLRKQARAIIRAMREPTEAMMVSGGTAVRDAEQGHKFKTSWQAAIDTALQKAGDQT